MMSTMKSRFIVLYVFLACLGLSSLGQGLIHIAQADPTDPHTHSVKPAGTHARTNSSHQSTKAFRANPPQLRDENIPVPTNKIPVIIVHGTWLNTSFYRNMATAFRKAGLPTYMRDFGGGGALLNIVSSGFQETKSVPEATKQLADFVAYVLKRTGAPQVDLVGHSQGGLIIKDYIAHDNRNTVRAVVDLGATNHGTTLSDVLHDVKTVLQPPLQDIVRWGIGVVIGQGATDQLIDSQFIHRLDRTPDTKAGIHYLVLATKDDAVSTPYENTFLKAVPGADVINQEVHTIPGVTGFVDHPFDLQSNPVIIRRIIQFLQEKGEPH